MPAADPVDYYTLLGITPMATPDDVRHAWRNTARRLHPDTAHTGTPQENQDEFVLAALAYETLSDPSARRDYDRATFPGALPPPETPPPAPRASNPRRGYSPLNQEPPDESAGESGPRGQDLRAQMTIGFSAAVFGSVIEVYLTRREVCRTCEGTPPPQGCPACGEEGTELVETLAEVTTPPGIASGSTVTVPEAGDMGSRAGVPGDRRGVPGPAGDLVVEFTVTPIKGVVMQGSDLVYDLPVDVIDALLGSQHQLRLLDGPATVVAVPGCPPGHRIRIPGRGVPITGAVRGDAFAEIRFLMRTHLSAEERRALDGMRKRR